MFLIVELGVGMREIFFVVLVKGWRKMYFIGSGSLYLFIFSILLKG